MSGLVQARNLQRAAGGEGGTGDEQTRRRTVEDFVRVWEAEIREHFDDEERLLLPLTSDAAMRERLLRDHGEIRELAEMCRREPTRSADPATMLRLGALLHDHIRWEEREFFEAVQRDHPGALEAMEHEAAGIEARRPHSRARSTLAWHELRENSKETRP